MGEVDLKEVFAARLGVSGEMLRLVTKRFAETGGDVLATIWRKKRDLENSALRWPAWRTADFSSAQEEAAVAVRSP